MHTSLCMMGFLRICEGSQRVSGLMYLRLSAINVRAASAASDGRRELLDDEEGARP
jgi:hypothetical protein